MTSVLKSIVIILTLLKDAISQYGKYQKRQADKAIKSNPRRAVRQRFGELPEQPNSAKLPGDNANNSTDRPG